MPGFRQASGRLCQAFFGPFGGKTENDVTILMPLRCKPTTGRPQNRVFRLARAPRRLSEAPITLSKACGPGSGPIYAESPTGPL